MAIKRVVITGAGTINSVAHDLGEFSRALHAGRCGVKPVTVIDPEGHRTAVAAEVGGVDLWERIPRPLRRKRMSRADRLGMIAAHEALQHAGLLPFPRETAPAAGVSLGSGAGGLLSGEDFFQKYLAAADKNRLPWSWMAPTYGGATADHITDAFGFLGPKTTFMTACSSGANALGQARDWIASGLADVVLAGGSEPICRMTYTAFNALRAVDPEYCKPFDRRRQGMSLGEGACFVVMESLDHASARGAAPLVEFLGYGLSGDAYHMTAPDPQGEGAARAMRAALSDAGLRPEDVDYINAHGTGTPANDVTETRAIKAVFGDRAYDIPISSTKSMIGHTLGAAGALEAAAVILALTEGFIPPTIHLEEPDPECDLDYTPKTSRPATPRTALSNSFAFGGNNTSLILGRYEEALR
jgi:3-oxoacyl-[acyl-carrier-protein] synthase II